MTTSPAEAVNLRSERWGAGQREDFLHQQMAHRDSAGRASGSGGAVTVAYNAMAARAGLEALVQGGNALDAALTAALAQVALTAGAPISYFGIMSLVYLDAKSGQVHSMNAEWNTVKDETDPMSIPGAVDFSSTGSVLGTAAPSGRTALVGGFMKGVEAAHQRFGRLPFASLFGPAIEIAETGAPVNRTMAWCYELRRRDLARRPETAAALLKPDGSGYREGEMLRQPRLAETLGRIAEEGAGYMYGGPWGRRLVDAVRSEGGRMTMEDLEAYDVIWSDALTADIGRGYSIASAPWPNAGGISMIEAQNIADVAGLTSGPHWTESAESLRAALNITQLIGLMFLPADAAGALFPGLDMSPESRVTRSHAEQMWARLKEGNPLANWKRTSPMHSDDVVAVDADGNMAAITQSINCVLWGKTAINVDGISIGDPASFQQAQIAAAGPGNRLPAPTETGIVAKDGVPTVAFASMGAGLHHRTFQAILNHTAFQMPVDEAVDSPDFFMPSTDPSSGEITVSVPAGRFDKRLLEATGYAWQEVADESARLGGEGHWVAISRDPSTGQLRAASANRTNSAAVAI
jgi:gamma-glutamyltranspeptidase/glutathione hydrolase